MREQFALPESEQSNVLHRLVTSSIADEAAMLSTCNRTELYCETTHPEDIVHWFANVHNINPNLVRPYTYIHQSSEGIRHTLRVATGLDSMMLGEPQILGQMKQAFHAANEAGTLKQQLRHTFEYVFKASKRIRHQSGIGNNPISVASAAVQLLGQHVPTFHQLRVFIIGSGETASLVAKYLKQHDVKKFMVASRTLHHAEKLAATIDGAIVPVNDIAQYLSQADVIISATTCPVPFISQPMVQHALSTRNNAPMFFLDLAVPRDIEENVKTLDNVHLYTIDDLVHITDHGMQERQAAAVKAEQLITLELDNYHREHRASKANHLIRHYRDHMETLADAELKRAIDKLSGGHCQFQVLEELKKRLLKKLIHTPTTGLREAAEDNRHDLLELFSYVLQTSSPLISQQAPSDHHETIA